MEMENYVADAKYLLQILITHFILTVTEKKGLVKLRDIEWVDEDTSFDIWPQYAIIASLLDETIKSKGKDAV